MNKQSVIAAVVVSLFLVAVSGQAADGKMTGEFGWFGVGKAHEMTRVISSGSGSSAAHFSTTRARAASCIAPE